MRRSGANPGTPLLMRLLLAACSLALLLSASWSSAHASSGILQLDGTEQSIDLQPWLSLRQTSSDTPFEQILAGSGTWTAASNYSNMQFGYSYDALWMKITLQSTAPQESLWHLYFPYSSLSRVVLYQEGQPERVSGLGVPLAERDYPHRNAVFRLRLAPGEQRTIYLRAESVGSLGVSSQLWSGAAFGAHSVSSSAMIALYCGLLLSLGLYHVLTAGLLRDGNYLLYGSYLLLFTLAVVAFSGLGGRYLWPTAGEWGTRFLPFGLTAANGCGVLLLRNLFIDKAQSSSWRIVADLLVLCSAGLALTSLLLSSAWGSRSIPWLAILSTGFALACLFRAARLRIPAARGFLCGAGFIALAIALFTVRATGMLPASVLNDFAVLSCSAISLLLISLALASRTQWQAKHHQHLTDSHFADLRDANAQAQAQLLEYVRDLDDARAKLHNMALEDPLTGLANRTALDRHINQALRRSRRRPLPLAVMLIYLDGFKHLHDQLGDDTADKMLCTIAQRLTSAARETDFVARLGGDQFVMVADELIEQCQAQMIAERLMDTLSQSIELEGQSISIGVSIGVTLTHAADLDLPELLRQADTARYSRKRSGRGGVSFHSTGTSDGQVI